MLTFIINVLVIYGVHASTRNGMILERLWIVCFNILNRFTKRPEFYLKPLFDCTPCMASVYGTAGYLIVYGLEIEIIVWVLSLTGFNHILNKIINR
jgi:hypothetical protein